MASVQSTLLSTRARSARVASGSNKHPPAVTPTSGGASAAPTPSNISLFLTNLRLLDLDLLSDWPDINQLTFTNKDLAQGQKKRIQSVEWALYQLFGLWDGEETRNKLKPFFPPMDQVQSVNLRSALLRCLEQAKKNGVLGRDAVIRRTMLDECKGERLEEVLAAFSSAVLKKVVAEARLNNAQPSAAAETMALENRGYSGETAQINALVLAHRASLGRLLQDKNDARARYADLARLLASKEQAMASRRAQLGRREELRSRPMPEHDKLAIWQAVRNNWAGNEQWMETLLYGDAPRDGLLTAPFDRVWRRTRAGRVTELDAHADPGLLAQLDERLNAHKERLQKWQAFRRDAFGIDAAKEDRAQKRRSLTLNHQAQATRQPRGIDLGFGAHERLHSGLASPRKLAPKTPALKQEYRVLVEGLQEELDAIAKGRPNPLTGTHLKNLGPAQWTLHDPVVDDTPEDSFPELDDLQEEISISAPALPKPRGAGVKGEELSRRPGFSETEPAQPRHKKTMSYYQPSERKGSIQDMDSDVSTNRRPKSLVLDKNTRLPSSIAGSKMGKPTAPARNAYPSAPAEDWIPEDAPTTSQPPPPQPPKMTNRDATRQLPPRTPSPPPAMVARISRNAPTADLPQPAMSSAQQEADAILASMSNASPSPEKAPRPVLSLAERTRLSMIRGGGGGGSEHQAYMEDDDNRLALQRRGSTRRATEAAADDGGGEAQDDLVARTRRSMANFEASRQKAQLQRTRSQRKAARDSTTSGVPGHRRNGGGSVSVFPSTLEEGTAGDGESVLVDEMLDQGVDDYESVFKSRPRIKTSPRMSPVR